MDVGAVCAVVVAAFAARKLVDVLQMIRTGFPGISHDHLTVLVPESDCGRVCAFSRHALILPFPKIAVVRRIAGGCESSNPALNRLKDGVYVDSVGTLWLPAEVMKPALLKEQASPEFREAQALEGRGVFCELILHPVGELPALPLADGLVPIEREGKGPNSMPRGCDRR
jgi:hypothetical protein